MKLFPVVQLHEFFSKMNETILKISKIDESQWFDTLHDALRFLNRMPVFRLLPVKSKIVGFSATVGDIRLIFLSFVFKFSELFLRGQIL